MPGLKQRLNKSRYSTFFKYQISLRMVNGSFLNILGIGDKIVLDQEP